MGLKTSYTNVVAIAIFLAGLWVVWNMSLHGRFEKSLIISLLYNVFQMPDSNVPWRYCFIGERASAYRRKDIGLSAKECWLYVGKQTWWCLFLAISTDFVSALCCFPRFFVVDRFFLATFPNVKILSVFMTFLVTNDRAGNRHRRGVTAWCDWTQCGRKPSGARYLADGTTVKKNYK